MRRICYTIQSGQEDLEKTIPYTEANMAIAQAEAFGEIAIEYTDITQEEVIAAMSEACEQTIFAGIDVVLSDGGTHHFSLDVKDQINIMVLQSKLLSGAESIPYHADDGKYYTLSDVDQQYRDTVDKLIAKGILNGREGTGEDRVLDMSEDAVRLLVILDRAGIFG